MTRKKASGVWPKAALEKIRKKYANHDFEICENRDVEDPLDIEKKMNDRFPFFDFLKSQDLSLYSRYYNNKLEFITHHLAHAHAAMLMSPFDKCIIIVIDGAGSKIKQFEKNHPEKKFFPNYKNIHENTAEERSIYLFDNGQLQCVQKKWQTFKRSEKYPTHYFSEGLGTMYEKAAEYIFNSKRAAGKVMGLAPLSSEFLNIENSEKFLDDLDWSKSFQNKDKNSWEQSPNLNLYKKISLSVQKYFEKNILDQLKDLRIKYPEYNRIILTGGCALNCTTNIKILEQNIFDEVFVPPNPGDESIGLGTAYYKFTKTYNPSWRAWTHDIQNGFFGATESMPTDDIIFSVFQDFEITKPDCISKHCANLLADGKIIGWFQGRSEIGPRSLGHRSILARPDKIGVKDELNLNIKFRESFRPYGSSVLDSRAETYFHLPKNFKNPYMSFAVQVKAEYKTKLSEVTHVDNTSRMQTVIPHQNEKFYKLISDFGDLTGLFCVLNTSLNIMGEPIIETIQDACKFLDTVPVYGMAVEKYFIRKKL